MSPEKDTAIVKFRRGPTAPHLAQLDKSHPQSGCAVGLVHTNQVIARTSWYAKKSIKDASRCNGQGTENRERLLCG
ncbi:hypothetical protein CGZ80_07340 [Rhodopirellula sp. MGV]|nr:hypothetical protein CGZ80_07340 [Rhodopirellula sp. MGV]